MSGPTPRQLAAAIHAVQPLIPRTDPQTIDPTQFRRTLVQLADVAWRSVEPFGHDGWRISSSAGHTVLVTVSDLPDDPTEYIHASISHANRIPFYKELTWLHAAAFGPERWAYQVFAPKSAHINIHPRTLHLWGRLDGQPVLPDFGAIFGSI